MIKNKDVSGVYIILVIIIMSCVFEILNTKESFRMSVDFNIVRSLVDILYLTPIILIILFIQKKRGVNEMQKILSTVLIFALVATFLDIYSGGGIFIVMIAFITTLFIYLVQKLRKKSYEKPFLHVVLISIFLFIILITFARESIIS